MAEGYLLNDSGNASAYLNHIEIGYTATINLVGGAGNVVPVYSTNIGRYMRINDRCYIDIILSGDGGNEGAGTGSMIISLPVITWNNSWYYFPIGTMTNGATTIPIFGAASSSVTVMYVYYFSDYSTMVPVTGADQNNTTRSLRIQFSYSV